MKILIMCEGSNELEVMRILLDHNRLIFTADDLLGLRPFHARQINKSAVVRTELNLYQGDVRILRIGDKQGDRLKIPSAYKDKIISTEKYCTKPELEMLLIIEENLLPEFNKVKSRTKAKDFAKNHIKYGRRKYDNSSAFYREYFGNRPDILVHAIKEYRKYNSAHKKDEHYLAELLK